MSWFQSPYTKRFNARHKLWGHLFQGRHQALLVDAGEYFRTVADYIHMNSARAHAFNLATEALTEFKCGLSGLQID